MAKKLSRQGRRTLLPLAGDEVVAVCLDTRTLPALVFSAADGSESELRLADVVHLRRGASERVLEGAKPGPTFDPKALTPLVELLGCTVREAVATADGRLQVTFSNALTLEIAPTGPGEAWHFQYPRPGLPAAGKESERVDLHGAPGQLI